MIRPPVPAQENRRLEMLRSYGILDTGPEAEFDAITRVAARICGTPIALISLIDETRQWFKSKVGLRMTETSRDISFCAHGLERSEPLVVPDTEKDPRFSGNPLVTSDPAIRFYCGIPLRNEGLGMGSLCVLDTAPRTLAAEQMEALAVLSDAVVTRLQLRRALQLLDEYRIHMTKRNDSNRPDPLSRTIQ